jgi:hypothetical protein
MITITCSNCQTQLTMDEAFAGGVCRCQHCGTIQTVPKTARSASDTSGGTETGADPSQKTLWRQTGTTEATPGTGLDDLADIVASSGLAGSGLQSKRLRHSAPPTDETAAKKKKMMILGAIGGGVLAILLVVLFLIFGRGSGDSTGGANPDGTAVTSGGSSGGGSQGSSNNGGSQTPAVAAGPNFAGVKLDSAHTIVYILDRGSGTQNVFSDLKALTIKSVQSLTADRKFQVLFWEVRGEVIAYPESSTTVAGDVSVSELTRKLDDVGAFGSSTAVPALKQAAAAKPDAIILATGKGDDLDDDFVAAVTAALPKGAKIYAFALGKDRPSKALQDLANKTGGTYRTLTSSQVSDLAK